MINNLRKHCLLPGFLLSENVFYTFQDFYFQYYIRYEINNNLKSRFNINCLKEMKYYLLVKTTTAISKIVFTLRLLV